MVVRATDPRQVDAQPQGDTMKYRWIEWFVLSMAIIVIIVAFTMAANVEKGM